jgi:hypothetical protein
MSAAYLRRKQRRAERCAEWTAIADRMQLVVETLTSDYYGDSILVDYAMAHPVIAYCRRVADGRREDNRAGGPFHEMMTFLHRHSQSAGWVMGGDMKFMILQSANGTSSRQPPLLGPIRWRVGYDYLKVP